MATRRVSPFLWVTWLAKAMAGDCQWHGWFRTHYVAAKKEDNTFDLTAWTVEHTRMVDEIRTEVVRRGGKAYLKQQLIYDVSEPLATVKGERDCLADEGDILTVHECKTGQQRPTDEVRLMIYMHMLAMQPRFSRRAIQGVVVYKTQRVEFPCVHDSFPSNFDYFVESLAGMEPPGKSPGSDCRFCDITLDDCVDRVDA